MLLALLLIADALPSQTRLEAAVREALAGSCPGAAVAIDPDLTRGCRAYVDAAAAGRSKVSGSAASFYASLQSIEPAPVSGVATVSPPSRADRAVGDLFPRSCRFNRNGVGAAVLPSGEALVCALAANHGTNLSPIPGLVEPGASVEVKGRLAPGLTHPRLYAMRPSGEVEELKLATGPAGFSAQVLLRDKGEHSLEILADGAGGPQVCALRRVFAGVPAPTSSPPEPPAGRGLPGVEASIHALRAAHGLPALERDPELDAVAEGHCREMVRLRTFAHVLPTDGNLTDRLRKRGYAYRMAGENIGLSDAAETAHDAIVGSPAHLANLLDPRHRRLGLGAVKGATSEGSEAVYLTEVLALPIVGSADPAGDVAALILETRKKRGLPALARDRTLDAIARREAQAAAKAEGPLKIQGDAAGEALDALPDLRSAVAEVFVSSAPDEATASTNLSEPRWTRLGVGALYGSSKVYGSGRLWVVLLYGR